ncbi:DUF5986 family protein [Lysinibacillus piscis]|uniref:Uncharacterized protein n=1 Tax=Lysinibacillus piscis TaxID=2518931 RepID=A0ABQ5NGU8_9BACI|nr:DUF5986 family protein [Lysinibacillus sp. KH24]GLC87509.1 hypothetical protein LYSBPC_06360 [Lysinibacillus sp. KH24]
MDFLKNELFMRKLVRSFAENTENTLDEIEINYNMDSGNFRHGGSWDIRFGRIENSVKDNDDIIVLNRERGIWKYKATMHLLLGALFIFTKEKNLDKVIKEKHATESIHYFHALVFLNDKTKSNETIQLTLFDLYDKEFEDRRQAEVQKILMECYSLVKQVYFVVGTEREKQIVEVKVQHYNNKFEFLKEVDLSHYISKGEYEDVLPNINKYVAESSPKSLVGIKSGLKKRYEKQIADRKKEKQDKENQES